MVHQVYTCQTIERMPIAAAGMIYIFAANGIGMSNYKV